MVPSYTATVVPFCSAIDNFDNKELRARDHANPEVAQQIETYSGRLTKNHDQVRDSYRQVCCNLRSLLLPDPGMAPSLPASEVIRAGEAEGHGAWARWMRERYRLEDTR